MPIDASSVQGLEIAPAVDEFNSASFHQIPSFEKQLADEASSTSIGEAWDSAMDLMSHASTSAYGNVERGIPAVAGYSPSDEELKASGIPEEDWPLVGDSISPQHFEFKKMRYFDEMEDLETLGRFGMLGTIGLGFGVSLTDPASLATGFTGGVLANSLVKGAKVASKLKTVSEIGKAIRFNRMKAIGTSAVVAGAEGVGFEAMTAQNNVTATNADLVYAGLFSMGMGAIGGKLALGKYDDATAIALSRAMDKGMDAVDDVVAEAYGITPNANKAKPSDVVDTVDDVNNNVDALGNKVNNNVDTLGDSAGAQRASTAYEPDGDKLDDILDEGVDVEESAYNTVTLFGKKIPLRFSLFAQFNRSSSKVMRKLGNSILSDAVGNKNKSKATQAGGTVEEFREMLLRTMDMKTKYKAHAGFSKWLKAMGINESQGSRSEFMTLVGRYRRQGDAAFDADVTPEIKAAVKQADEGYTEGYTAIAELAQRYGVKGMENINDSSQYFNRIFNRREILRLNSTERGVGELKMVELLKEAMRRNNEFVVNDEYLTAIAQGYWRTLVKIAQGKMDEGMNLRGMTLDNRELFESILDEAEGLSKQAKANLERLVDEGELSWDFLDEVEGITDGSRAAIQQRLDDEGIKSNKKRGVVSHAKRRLEMDEGTTVKLLNGEGVEEEIGIASLYENNIEKAFGRYLDTMSGHVSFARAGFKSKGDFTKMLDAARQEAVRANDDKVLEKVSGEIDTMNRLYDHLTGRSLEDDPTSGWSNLLRHMRDWNFVRLMNQVGFAQIPEFGVIFGTLGWKTTLAHVPELVRVFKRSGTGHLADDFLDELEVSTGIATDWVRGKAFHRFDEYEEISANLDRGGFYEGLEATSHKLKRATSMVSGMTPITQVMQRLAMKAIAQKFLNIATDAKAKGSFMNRLRSYGFTDAGLEKVLANIKKADTTDSMFVGRKIKRLNLDEWDADARELFEIAMYRIARKVVQENDLGSSAMWMHKSWGKTLGQFRSFMIHAYEKQLLHGVHQGDMRTFQTFMTSMFLAGTAYYAQKQFASIGRSDRDEYLERMASPEKVAAAAFARAGFASFLPAIYSTGANLAGHPEADVFSGSRSTGLGTSFISGNPSVDLINRVGKVPASIIGSATRSDYDFSQQDTSNLKGLVPIIPQMMGTGNLINLLESNLPEKSKE